MLNKYGQVVEHLKSLSLDKTVKCLMPPFGPSFDAAATTAMLRFQDFDAVTKVLQMCLLSLSRCIEYSDRLIHTVEKGKQDLNSHWYLTDFDTTYIDSTSSKWTDKAFLRAVCKMQRRLGSTLDTVEKRAIAKWMPRTTSASTNETGRLTLAEQLHNKRRSKRKVAEAIDSNGNGDGGSMLTIL